MNPTTRYEQLIAEKLEQLPVPDMADSVWSVIGTQLDATPHVPERKSPPGRPGKGWYGLIMLAAAAAILWWVYGHKEHSSKSIQPVPTPAPVIPKPLPAIGPPPVRDSHISDKPGREKDIPLTPSVIKNDSVLFPTAPGAGAAIDSILPQQLPPSVKDSFAEDPSYTPLPHHDKKIKGVKGITNDDYKLSASKDSGRKKH